jgi:hypothetical protein
MLSADPKNLMDIRFSSEQRAALQAKIRTSLTDGRPLSLVRPGDGEAYPYKPPEIARQLRRARGAGERVSPSGCALRYSWLAVRLPHYSNFGGFPILATGSVAINEPFSESWARLARTFRWAGGYLPKKVSTEFAGQSTVLSSRSCRSCQFSGVGVVLAGDPIQIPSPHSSWCPRKRAWPKSPRAFANGEGQVRSFLSVLACQRRSWLTAPARLELWRSMSDR